MDFVDFSFFFYADLFAAALFSSNYGFSISIKEICSSAISFCSF